MRPSGRTYHFNEADATQYGVLAALIISHIEYCLQDMRDGKNFRTVKKGYYWYFQSSAAFVEKYPWVSEETVRRTILMLSKEKVIIRGRFSHGPKRRTNWFTMPEYRLSNDEVQLLRAQKTEDRELSKPDEANPQNEELSQDVAETLPQNEETGSPKVGEHIVDKIIDNKLDNRSKAPSDEKTHTQTPETKDNKASLAPFESLLDEDLIEIPEDEEPDSKPEPEPKPKKVASPESKQKKKVSRPRVTAPAFERFWKHYPRRVSRSGGPPRRSNKDRAKQIYNKMPRSERIKAWEYLPKLLEQHPDGIGYAPDMSRYLNAKEWENTDAEAPAESLQTQEQQSAGRESLLAAMVLHNAQWSDAFGPRPGNDEIAQFINDKLSGEAQEKAREEWL